MSTTDYLDKKDNEGFNGLPMTQTCTMSRDMQPVSVETLTRAMQEIGLLPKPDQWIVVDPQGRMYKGTVEQVTRVLVQAHPLMRTPVEPCVCGMHQRGAFTGGWYCPLHGHQL